MEGTLKVSALCAASALFMAPLHDFEDVRRKKKVGERAVFPFVCMWANSTMWLVYGLYTGDIFPTVLTNTLGLLFSMYYCAVFVWAVEPPARKTEAYNMFAGTFFVVCLICTYCLGSFSSDPRHMADSRVIHYAGMAASASTAVQYASPLAELVKVIRRRSTEGLSSLLAGVSLTCASLWLCYGWVTDDAFIYVPNVLGVVFSSAQCSLFYIFPRHMKKGKGRSRIGPKELSTTV